uniref:SLAM family member 8 isoform X1 n=1 Tax=Geotrypetes seraphini TaxID=260995 RepID=A0A6P8Q115_GEOSA|nr:SLAM family member 8 isoform X1 [Geotrypetes seraphini]XP_033780749.1 SLAM family member 8 isoform X1 [Geotrypetes seraphini]
MHPVYVLLMLLHCQVNASSILVQGVVGESVSLTADLPQGFVIREILWKHLTSKEEIVATSFKGSVETLYRSRFLERIGLLSNFSLQISPLELGDSGTFKALLVGTEGQLLIRILQLAVYEKVSKPTIGVFISGTDLHHISESSCEVFLTCSTQNGSGVSYIWRREDGTLRNESYSFLDGGKVLRVQLEPSDRQASLSCTVANPVSHESTAVTPWSICQGKTDDKATACEYKYLLFIVLPLLILFFAAAVPGLIYFLKGSGKKTLKDAENGIEVDENASSIL